MREALPLPDFLHDRFRELAERKAAKDDEARRLSYYGDFDKPCDVQLAIYRIGRDLEEYGDPPPKYAEKTGIDERAFKLLVWLLDRPLTLETVVDLVHEHWAPDYDVSWLTLKARNALAYRQRAQGVDHWEQPSEIRGQWRLDNPCGPCTPPPPDYVGRFEGLRVDEIEELEPIMFLDPEKLLPDYGTDGGTIIIYGPSHHHKSNKALLTAVLLARAGVPVVYACGEGRRGFRARLRAIRAEYGITRDEIRDNLLVCNVPKGFHAADVADFEAFICARQPGCRLVIIDTIKAAFAGVDYDEKAAAQLTRNGTLGGLAASLGAMIMLIGHTNKNKKVDEGMSDAYGWENNCDAMISCQADADQNANIVKLHVRRMRDGEDGFAVYNRIVKRDGVPVLVPGTKAEWDFYTANDKKEQKGLSFDDIRGILVSLQAGCEAPVSATRIARELIQKGELSEEEYGKATSALAQKITDRANTDLFVLNERGDDGVPKWFIRV